MSVDIQMTETSQMVCVDRSIRPAYPRGSRPLYPKLEQSGPEQYALDSLEQYLFGNQLAGGYEQGNHVFRHLRKKGLLDSCLNMQDALAIQALGIENFRKYFKGKAVFFWKSVARRGFGLLCVPYLVERDGEVVLLWYWLVNGWRDLFPALRLPDTDTLGGSAH